MALTPDEREELFKTLAEGETVESRAEAIVRLRGELEEETVGRNELSDQLEVLTGEYNKSSETVKNLLNSLDRTTKSKFSNDPETKDDEKTKPYGFNRFIKQ